MSTYHMITSKLGSGNVIDIQGGSNALDASTPHSHDNQLWEFVSDPAGSGYYFIKSKLSGGDVISITGSVDQIPSAGAALNVATQQQTQTNNQLWKFVEDPAGSGYCFIMSAAGMVIDVEGASTNSGTALDAYPMKASGTDNQLWKVADGSFPATVSTAPPPVAGLGSQSNYVIYNGCSPITNVLISINVTQDIVCGSVGPATHGCTTPKGTLTTGFGFQLNCYSAKGHQCVWQQYVMAFYQDSSDGFNVGYQVNSWDSSLKNPLINSGFNSIATLPNAVLPAGYSLTVGCGNQNADDPHDPINQGSWGIQDSSGKWLWNNSELLTQWTTHDSYLAPITAFELNVVGPVNGEVATLKSGAGYISYAALTPISVSPLPVGGGTGELRCTDTNTFTCETANTAYSHLPSSNDLLVQSFEVSATVPRIRREGPARSTPLSEADRQTILGS